MSRSTRLFLVRLGVYLGRALMFLNASIAEDPPKNAKDGAPQVATGDDVLKELRRLSANVQIDDTRNDVPETVAIELHDKWQGTSDDFKLISRIPNLDRLGVFGVPITDDDLKQLDGLNHFELIKLFGTKVTADGAARLAKIHPGVEIDRRGTASSELRENPTLRESRSPSY
jgi:hypothetical protein